MGTTIRILLVLAGLVCMALPAQAQDAVRGGTLYRTPGLCISCHGDPPDSFAQLAAGNVGVLNIQIFGNAAGNPGQGVPNSQMSFLSFLTVQDRKDIVAYIANPDAGAVTYTLTVTKAGTGTGTVVSNDGFLNCGPACPTAAVGFAGGTTVTLTPTASAGSVFAGWNGSGLCPSPTACPINMTTDLSVTAVFNLLAAQTIVFGGAPSITVGGTGTVSATGGGSGNPVIFTSQTTSKCTVSGTTVTGVSAGTCTIAANQAGSASFSAAPQVTLSFSIAAANSGPQTITFNNPGNRNLSQGALTLVGTASSGLAVSFSSSTSAVCAVNAGVVSFFGPGTCTITASQAGNGTIPAATSVVQSFTVSLPALAPLSKRGGIDIDGLGKAAVPMTGAGTSLKIGRLNGLNQLVFTDFAGGGPNLTTNRLVGIADFDGDGKSDLAYQTLTTDPDGVFGDVRIWTNFNSGTDHLMRTVKLAWLVQAVADQDGDGLGDMTFRFTGDDGVPNDTGVSFIWFVNTNGSLQVRKRGGAPLSWTLLGAADLNYDGAADMIYISPAPGSIIKALMATPGRTCANLNAGGVPDGFTVLKLADFTGNRRGDILVRNAATGDTQLLSLNASGLALPPFTGDTESINSPCTGSSLVVTNTTIGLPNVNPTWSFFAAGDFDGDGITDIVWKQPDGTLTLWLMTAGGTPNIIANAGTAPVGFTVFQP